MNAESTAAVFESMRHRFRPCIAVLTSPDAESVCQRNNLTFVDLLLPFSQMSTEAVIKDPSNQNHVVRSLPLDLRDLRNEGFYPSPVLQQILSHVVQNASVATEQIAVAVGQYEFQVPGVTPWFNEYLQRLINLLEPCEHEFLKHYLACILVVSTTHVDPLEQLSQLSQLQHSQQHQLNSVTINSSSYFAKPKWFSPNIFKYHLLLHDVSTGDEKKAESVYQSMKMTFGANACHLLRINSANSREDTAGLPDPWHSHLKAKRQGLQNLHLSNLDLTTSAVNNVQMGGNLVPQQNSQTPALSPMIRVDSSAAINGDLPPQEKLSPMQLGGIPKMQKFPEESLPHPLSSANLMASFANGEEELSQSLLSVKIEDSSLTSKHGCFLTTSDLDRIKIFIQEFIIRGLLPFVERQMRILNDQMQNRKNLQKSVLSVTRKWFGGSNANSAIPQTPTAGSTTSNALAYPTEAIELQIRRLADLAFLFQQYEFAYTLFHGLKRDFANDQAWLHCAGAMEMAALANFMMGQTAWRSDYMETALQTYMNSCNQPLLAVRCSAMHSEILCLQKKFGEAAEQFIRATTPSSDLSSAMMLEQAALCFVKAKLVRKFALHMILAGHRFGKSNLKAHALRCYEGAYQLFTNRGWRMAEDHINFTSACHALSLRQNDQAVRCFRVNLLPGTAQKPAQQFVFLRDYLNVLKSCVALASNDCLPHLPVPVIKQKETRVFPGGQLLPHSSFSADLWKTAEIGGWLVAGHHSGAFHATAEMLDNSTDNTKTPFTPLNEPFVVEVHLENPLDIPMFLLNVSLLWEFESDEGTVVSSPKLIKPLIEVETVAIDYFFLPGRSSEAMRLSVIPRRLGHLHILGLSYWLACPQVLQFTEDGQLETTISSNLLPDPNIQVFGQQSLEAKGRRLNSTKQEKINVVFAVDRRLQPKISHSLPKLEVEIGPGPLKPDCFCCEIVSTTLTFQNVGCAPISALIAIPLQDRYVSLSPLDSFDAYESTKFSLRINETETIDVPAFRLNANLNPQSSFQCRLIIRTPEIPGSQSVAIMIYYESRIDGQIRHRSHRVELQFQCYPCMSMGAFAEKALGATAEVVVARLAHSYQPPEGHRLSLYPISFALISRTRKITKMLSTIDSVEAEENCICCLESESTTEAKEPEVSCWAVSPVNDFDLKPWPGLLNRAANNHDVVVFNWKAVFISLADGSVSMSVFGQSHCPLLQAPKQSPVATTVANSSLIAAIFCHLECAAHMTHDFGVDCFCKIPVDVRLINHSSSPRKFEIATIFAQSDLLNPYRTCSPVLYMSATRRIIVVPAHGTEVTRLTAIASNPGVFDLSRTLVVKNAPALSTGESEMIVVPISPRYITIRPVL